MRKLDSAQARERLLSYFDFCSDPQAQAIGLDSLAIMDNVALNAHLECRTTHEAAPAVDIPRQVGRTVCLNAEVSLGMAG